MASVGELNKGKVRLFIEAVLNDGRLELINELVAADFIGRIPWDRGRVLGPDGVRRLVAARRNTHPELYVKIDDLLAEEDLVATRWQLAPAGADLGNVRRGGRPVVRRHLDRPHARGQAGRFLHRVLEGAAGAPGSALNASGRRALSNQRLQK